MYCGFLANLLLLLSNLVFKYCINVIFFCLSESKVFVPVGKSVGKADDS